MPKTHSRSARGRRLVAIVLAVPLIAAGLVSPAAAATPGLDTDPVLDLRFENDVADSSASAHPTTVRGHRGATPQSPANLGYVPGVTAGTTALELRGDAYVDLGTSTALQPQDLTVSFWINPTAALDGEHVITWNKGAYNSDGWYLSSESATSPLALSIGPSTGQPYKVRVTSADRAAFFPVGQWTHVVATYDHLTKEVQFFRNGERAASTVAEGITADATGVLGSSESLPKTIGFNGPEYSGAYLKAGLDEYRLWDDVASLTDAVALYEESGRTIDRAAVARSDADGLTLPGTASVGLILAGTGSRGSDITWTSSDADVIAPDGTVTRPAEGEEDAEVTLTASVSYLGGPVVTRTFDIAVPAVSTTAPNLLEDSGLENVLVTDDYLVNAAAKEHEYLLTLDSQKFLHEFYVVAGLEPPTDEGYGGWERSNAVNFRGHAFGHYMSALAQAYATSRDAGTKAALRVEIDEAVDGLAEVQAAYAAAHPASAGYVSAFRESALDRVQGTGQTDENVIVPWYNLHKVLAGLLDIAEYVEDGTGDEAFEIAEAFGVYVYNRVAALPNTTTLLSTEYGGMNEALYELYDLTGDPRIETAAQAFDEVTLFRQLAAGQDVLNGKHANTTIPKLIGALKRYTVMTENEEYYAALTEQEKADLPMYLAAAENFFDMVVDHHTYVIGANSQSEHFRAPDSLYQYAAGGSADANAQTAETCNEYNMLKLARELFKRSKDVRYADYYENTFINTIVSSQNPETGMTTYFQPMAPGYAKVYATQFTEFWCCWGTGLENFTKLGDSIYFTDRASVYVNMFFSSSFDYGAQNLRLTQTANMPNEDTVSLTVAAIDGTEVADGTTLRLRVPDWIAGSPSLTVNGVAVTPTVTRGYVVLEVAAGDVVEYTTPMQVELVDTPDNENFVAFKYGPVVLSTSLGTANVTASAPTGILVRTSVVDPAAQKIITVANGTTEQWKADLATNVVRVEDSADGQVQFRLTNTSDAGHLVYTPHFARHGERYGLYMNLEAPDSQQAQDRIRRSKEVLRDAEMSSDSLTNFDANNFEAEKNLQRSDDSSVGVFSGRQFRHAPAGGWFGYDLAIDPQAPANRLRLMLYGGDAGRNFDLYINGEKIRTVTATNAAGASTFYWDDTVIPAKFTTIGPDTLYRVDSTGAPVLDEDGQRIPVVRVKFQSTGGWVGGIFGIQVARTTDFDTTSELSELGFDAGVLAPAFSADRTEYTLTVPEGTASVGLEASPHTPSGLVLADDVLFDDTATRTVPLDEDGSTTLVLTSYAQNHTDSTTYTVTIVESDAPVPAPQFVDVVAGQDFYADIRWMADRGLSLGTRVGDEVFYHPTTAVSRQAMAAFMYRYAGDGWQPAAGATPSFTDVPATSPFFTAIEWMKAKGYATGYAGGTSFGPGNPVSRQAMAAFLWRMAGEPVPTRALDFPDVPVDGDFADAIAWADATGVAEGYADGTFGPTRDISRQAMAALLHRFDGLAD